MSATHDAFDLGRFKIARRTFLTVGAGLCASQLTGCSGMAPNSSAPEGMTVAPGEAGFLVGSIGLRRGDYFTHGLGSFRRLGAPPTEKIGYFKLNASGIPGLNSRVDLKADGIDWQVFAMALLPGEYEVRYASASAAWGTQGNTLLYGADPKESFTIVKGRATYFGSWELRRADLGSSGVPAAARFNITDARARDLDYIKRQSPLITESTIDLQLPRQTNMLLTVQR